MKNIIQKQTTILVVRQWVEWISKYWTITFSLREEWSC